MKEFNTTTICIPSKHYMVDISDRVAEIKKLVDAGKYFTINRARQYGKTTTLNALKQALKEEYCVINFSFEGITSANFVTEMSFVKAFCRLFRRNPMLYKTIPEEIKEQIDEYIKRKEEQATLDELFFTLQQWCEISEKPLVLFIDEVDSATNNQVFLDFLALLRNGYIARDGDGLAAFQSVVLAGVTDVKHMKAKIRDEAEARENSPWNVAADFKIDMSLPEDGIKGMLDEYEADHHTGMDTVDIAQRIRTYLVIHYLGRRYVIELKIWHGERYNEKGEKQISEYLEYYGLSTGYLLSFNFNKKKETGVKQVHFGDKMIYEGIV